MATSRRRKKLTVIDSLFQNPSDFDFFQAVRLLEIFARKDEQAWDETANKPIGYDHPAALEAIRFRVNQSLKFPDREIVTLDSRLTTYNKQERAQFLLSVSLMGLTGASGVLPYHYTEMILQRIRYKDFALGHFLDLFNHRSLSIYYRAANKYRFNAHFEQQDLTRQDDTQILQTSFPKADLFTEALRSIAGLNTARGLQGLPYLNDNILRYTAFFAQRPRSTTNLGRMLAEYFQLPVNIDSFKAQWQEIIPDMLTRLPAKNMPRGQNAQLGQNAMLGHRIWSAQSKFQVNIGPLNYEQYQSLGPDSPKLKALHSLIRLYVGIELDYDIMLSVPAREMPVARMDAGADQPIQLGWNTFMQTSDQAEKMVKIRISQADY
ncbi:MAG: type VI secretion system baseplate subunit TssG [Ketobacteraceae bacterium]|nr:type VI secretion system baseplate subunit TssG [Ketobacteraceae bacterium]